MIKRRDKLIMIIAVIVAIIVVVPVILMEYPVQKSAPLPQIGVQASNSTYTYDLNKTTMSSSPYCEALPNIMSKVFINESGFKNSTISIRVWGGFLACNNNPIDLSMTLWVHINGSLSSNLKPSGLTILQGIQTPNVPECVGGNIRTPYTNNTNISCAKYEPGYPSFYSHNASSMKSMHVNESFVNDSDPSNTSAYNFKSILLFNLFIGPWPRRPGDLNWSTFANLFPLNFTTAVTINGLSKPVQVQVDIVIPGLVGVD